MSTKRISFPNGVTVDLPAPALMTIEDDGQRYVILDCDVPHTISDNVCCYSDDGVLRWRIEDIVPGNPNMFANGRIRRDGTLEFYNTDGVWIRTDKESGRATGRRIDRMGPSPESDSNVFKPIHWRQDDQPEKRENQGQAKQNLITPRGGPALKDLGDLIWESPSSPPAPKPLVYVISGVFIIVGLLLAIAVVPLLIRGMQVPRDRPGGIAGSVVMALLIGGGLWMIYRARNPKPVKGVEFFDNGVEYGPPGDRRRFTYSELQSVTFEPFDSNPTTDKAMAGARLAISIAEMNPAGIGYAIGELTAKKVEAFAVISPPDSPEFHVAIFDGVQEPIERAINAAVS